MVVCKAEKYMVPSLAAMAAGEDLAAAAERMEIAIKRGTIWVGYSAVGQSLGFVECYGRPDKKSFAQRVRL